MGKVIDAINFNGEFDILEIRLNTLNEHVDQFIIVETDMTFSGKPKQFFYPQQQERFKQFHPKITYIAQKQEELDKDEALNKLADDSPTVPLNMHWWHREFRQKESIKKYLTHLNDEDIVYVSDSDEIWKPQDIGEGIYKLEQKVYTFYLNLRSSEIWHGTFVTKYKNIKSNVLNYMRHLPPPEWVERLGIQQRIFLEDGGWHFTNQGGAAQVRTKIESYGHQEYNRQDIKDAIEDAMKNKRDYLNRPYTLFQDETDWPQYLKDNKERYATLCL